VEETVAEIRIRLGTLAHLLGRLDAFYPDLKKPSVCTWIVEFYRHMHMRGEPALVLDGAVMMSQFPKHSAFKTPVDDGVKEVVEIV